MKRSASIDTIQVTQCDSGGGEQLALKTGRISLTGKYMWSVNSTVTKHSDNFVWKDTSECVTQCCDDTSWQKASEFFCIKHFFFWGSPAIKRFTRNPQKYSLRRATTIFFSSFRSSSMQFFETMLRAVFVNYWINSLVWGQRIWEVVCSTEERRNSSTGTWLKRVKCSILIGDKGLNTYIHRWRKNRVRIKTSNPSRFG